MWSTEITNCPECNAGIRGDYIVTEIVFIGPSGYKPPAFCDNCGKPYPWTTKAIATAKELTDEMDGLTASEKADVKGDLDDIVHDSPRTKLAASRVKRLLAKASGELPGMAKDVIVSVASETAKKVLLG